MAVALCRVSGGIRCGQGAGRGGCGAARARDEVAAVLAVLTPQEDEAILREVGFSDVQMFYIGFTFRGRVTYF